MSLLEAAERLAVERGYLGDPIVVALLPKVPPWFRALGTPSGQEAFARSRGYVLPTPLREFYARVPLACFLDAVMDGEVFSADGHKDPPHEIHWTSGVHLAIGYHGHSASVCAAAVGRDDAFLTWGYEDSGDGDKPVGPLSDWVYGIVHNYEKTLDRLEAEKWARWKKSVLRMPGMKARFERAGGIFGVE